MPSSETVAPRWAVRTLAAMTAGPGFVDGEQEDQFAAVLASLKVGAGHPRLKSQACSPLLKFRHALYLHGLKPNSRISW